MNTMYKINKVVIIINVILFIIPYFGLLFLMVTGLFQLILFLIYLFKWNQIVSHLKKYFILYGLLAPIPIVLPIISKHINYPRDASLVISLSLAIALSLGFLYLSKQQASYSNKTHL